MFTPKISFRSPNPKNFKNIFRFFYYVAYLTEYLHLYIHFTKRCFIKYLCYLKHLQNMATLTKHDVSRLIRNLYTA